MATPKKKQNESKQDFLKRCTEQRVSEGEDTRSAFARCSAKLAADGGIVLSAPVQMLEAVGDKKRGFLIVAKTGAPITRWGWTTAIDIDGIKTEDRMPILREHMRDRVVGHGAGFKDGNKLMVEGEFSGVTADAAEVLALADEGYPWQASIGVWAKAIETIEAGVSRTVNGVEIKGPADIWTESFVREVSFVTLGADEDTAAIALADGHTSTQHNQQEKTMNLEELKKQHPELVDTILSQGREEGVSQERARVVEILSAEADPTETRTAISNGTPPGEAYKAFFQAEKSRRADGLKQLADQATPPQGQRPADNAPGNSGESNLAADVIVATRAKSVASEKGISYELACRQVLREDASLAEKYRALFTK